MRAYILLILRNIDELVTVHVVLRTPIVEANTLNAYISRLAITLEAHAIGNTVSQPTEGRDGQQSSPQQQQARETIFTKAISTSEKPLLVLKNFDPDTGSASHPHSYVVWPAEVFISEYLLVFILPHD